jgi:hypothetical protein
MSSVYKEGADTVMSTSEKRKINDVRASSRDESLMHLSVVYIRCLLAD